MKLNATIPEKYFPPTIKNILEGMDCQRLNAASTLVKFYFHAGYDWDVIEKKMYEWNQRNSEPLTLEQLADAVSQHRNKDFVAEPNDYEVYYRELGVYQNERLEQRLENPLDYAKKQFKARN